MTVKCFRARLMKVRLKLTASNCVTFGYGYAPKESDGAAVKNKFSLFVGKPVDGVPSGEHVVVTMDAYARTGKREDESIFRRGDGCVWT